MCFRFCCLTWLIWASIPASGISQSAKATTGRNFAFLATSASNQSAQVKSLPYALREMNALREVLQQCNFAPRNILSLTSQEDDPHSRVRRKNVIKQLETLTRELTRNDTLLVVLDGYLVHYEGSKNLYFLPLDGQLQSQSTLIPLLGERSIFAAMKRCQAEKKILIIHGYRLENADLVVPLPKGMTLDRTDAIVPPTGMTVLFSARTGQTSHDFPKRFFGERSIERSIFMHELIEALNGKTILDSTITLDRVIREVSQRTSDQANRELFARQQPDLRSDGRFEWTIRELTGRYPGEEFFQQALKMDYGLEGTKINYAEAIRLYKLAAEKGHIFAQNELASFYLTGTYVLADRTEAEKWGKKAFTELKKLAEQGNAYAQCKLGQLYQEGFLVTKDTQEAMRWFRKSAEQGNTLGILNLGNYYLSFVNGTPNYPEASKWLTQAGDRNCILAYQALGTYYADVGTKQHDYQKAFEWYLKAAEANEPVSQQIVGDYYRIGRVTNIDLKAAVKWYERAAEQNDIFALRMLGDCYRDALGVEKSEREAAKWYRKAAERGDATSQNQLAIFLQDGTGVKQDEKEAFEWLKKAAAQNFPMALNNIGWAYHKAQGVPRDDKEAVKWFRKGADLNNSYAVTNLGYMYANGYGLDVDKSEAFKCYQKGADLGLPVAMYNMGHSYEFGNGVTKDITKAVEWYRKALKGGYEDARKALKDLGYEP